MPGPEDEIRPSSLLPVLRASEREIAEILNREGITTDLNVHGLAANGPQILTNEKYIALNRIYQVEGSGCSTTRRYGCEETHSLQSSIANCSMRHRRSCCAGTALQRRRTACHAVWPLHREVRYRDVDRRKR